MPEPARPDGPIRDGGARSARADVTEHFYAELRRIAERIFASERGNHTLQPTAVVNEACLRLMSGGLPAIPREEQLAIAGRVLKQVLVDHARSRSALKRGGGAGGVGVGNGQAVRLDLEDDVLADSPTQIDFDAVHRAIDRLRALSDRQAEVVTLRMFGGLSMDQVATVLGVSKRSAEGDWTVARAWLRRELADVTGAGTP
jgi:RNA polymerase sigma factor (TIGR02999 family)